LNLARLQALINLIIDRLSYRNGNHLIGTVCRKVGEDYLTFTTGCQETIVLIFVVNIFLLNRIILYRHIIILSVHLVQDCVLVSRVCRIDLDRNRIIIVSL